MKKDEILRKFLSSINTKKIDLKEVCKSGDYLLYKVFDNGKTMDIPAGNPYRISIANWKKFSDNFEWVSEKHGENLVNRMKKLHGKENENKH